jgi:hypothetical protein
MLMVMGSILYFEKEEKGVILSAKYVMYPMELGGSV